MYAPMIRITAMPATRENTRQLLALQQKHVKTAQQANILRQLLVYVHFAFLARFLLLQLPSARHVQPARTIHSLENQSVLIVQQASFQHRQQQHKVQHVQIARLASIIHRLLNSAVLIVQQASFQKLQGEHSVPYVKTVQKARFLRQVQVSVILASLARTIHRLDNQSV